MCFRIIKTHCNGCNFDESTRIPLVSHCETHYGGKKCEKIQDTINKNFNDCLNCIFDANDPESTENLSPLKDGSLYQYTTEEPEKKSSTQAAIVFKNGLFYCPYCSKSFTRNSSAKVHINTSCTNSGKKTPDYKCDVMECTAVFTTKSDLSRHKRNVHENKTYICKFCNTILKRGDNVKRHENSAECKKRAAIRNNVTESDSPETGRNPNIKCQNCCIEFDSNVDLINHIKNICHFKGKEKPHKCELTGCEMAFASFSELKKHNRIHTGAKDFSCELCGKKFADQQAVKRHEGTKPCVEKKEQNIPPSFDKQDLLVEPWTSTEKQQGVHKKRKPPMPSLSKSFNFKPSDRETPPQEEDPQTRPKKQRSETHDNKRRNY